MAFQLWVLISEKFSFSEGAGIHVGDEEFQLAEPGKWVRFGFQGMMHVLLWDMLVWSSDISFGMKIIQVEKYMHRWLISTLTWCIYMLNQFKDYGRSHSSPIIGLPVLLDWI